MGFINQLITGGPHLVNVPRSFSSFFPFSKLWTDQKQGHPLTSSKISSVFFVLVWVSMSYITIYIYISSEVLSCVPFHKFLPQTTSALKSHFFRISWDHLRLRILWSLRPQQQELLRDFLPAPSSSIRIEVKNHWKTILVAASFFMMYTYIIYIYTYIDTFFFPLSLSLSPPVYIYIYR